MALAKATAVLRVRNLLQDSPWTTGFTGNINTTNATVPVPDGTLWDQGAIGEFLDDGEQFYVRSVSSNNLTVFRNWNFSVTTTTGTGTAHDGSGTAIPLARDPVFSYQRIVEAIEETITTRYWPYVYKSVSLDITPDSTKEWYDISSTFMAPIQASQITDGTPVRVNIWGEKGSGLHLDTRMNLPAALVTSTNGVRFSSIPDSNNTITFVYAAKITSTIGTSSYSDLADGMLADLTTYGAAARLAEATEIPRDTMTDVTMGEQTVAPLNRIQAASYFDKRFIELRNNVRENLRRTSPLMKSWRR